LSKVIERLVGGIFLPFLAATQAYGPNQFAYTPQRGLRDALALNLLNWIVALNDGFRIGLFCSDVSGAFDRVSSSRLLKKLRRKGVHEKVLTFLSSWLADRSATVVADGVQSDPQL
jgi:hypothetical protein